MIEQQIRTWDVLDEAVLTLYNEIWREDFIASPQQRPLAYADMALPIAHGEHMLEPKLEARMLQILAPKKTESILHIGCGSGFFAALLGRLAQSVISVEIHPELAEQAAARLRTVEDATVTVVNADGLNDAMPQAPFDAVVLTGSLPSLSQQLLGQVKQGGRLLAVVGTAPAMCLSSFEKHNSSIIRNNWLETHIPALHNAPPRRALNFKCNFVSKKFRFLPALALAFSLVSTPAVAQTTDTANIETGTAKETDAPPSLNELVLLAEEYHADFLAQEFDLQVEKENTNVSLAAFMPQLSSQWSDDNNQRSFSRDWLLRFSLSFPLFDAKAWEDWRVSQERVRFAEINFDLARQTLRRDVIVAWFNAQLAADVLDINETRRKTLREQAARAELLADAGKTTNTDVLSARASLANARAQWQQARHNLAIAQDAMIRYTGETATTARLNADSPLPSPTARAQWQERISRDSLSIAAMEQQIKFLRRQLRSVKAEYTPRLALSATHDLRGNLGRDQSVLGLSITQPLFTGGRLSAQKRQALGRLEAAYKRLTDVRRAQQQAVRRLHGQIESDLASIEALQEAVQTAEALLESVILGYNSGVRIATEVLSAEEDVFNARLELRQAAYRYLQNTVELQTLAAATDEAFTTEISTLFTAKQ